ncbi:hypothetical protein GCM10010988_16480 [Cnuibacter physcomitrellae]|uniref:Uncharacterized protein n=1 Tax=Cnuibacter physcomitrellae TaxID=1619308 RepID=A0A1X9LMH8_9MICO|nr:hypothetical protein [Cnuibacter physcomitrellae]ARJ06404.1 hypothetical protein B5808_15175 [Cnuibacter physcomitrellae]GGI37938.1 hypothetical protein GCM10010988_16480 [Cnuibacter physcomitrellae]
MLITRRTIGTALGAVSAVVLVASLAACAGDAQTPYETPRPSVSETSFTLPPLACQTERPEDKTSTPDASADSSSGSSAAPTDSGDDCSTQAPASGDDDGVDNEGNK